MTQYLILHKVRGEPSFDCAERVCQGEKPCQPNCGLWDGTRCQCEDTWITNSGYRAYPVQKWPLDGPDSLLECIPIADVPNDWPAHFEVRGEKVQPKIDIGAMLS